MARWFDPRSVSRSGAVDALAELRTAVLNASRNPGARLASSGRWIGDRIAALDAQPVSELLLSGVDRATNARWETAVERAAALPGSIRPDKIRALTDSFAREVALVGAAAGAAAAAPAVGTGATFAASAAEVAWFTSRAGDLILTIAALHGRTAPTVEERRAWVLAVLLFGGTAREGFAKVARTVGVSLDGSDPTGSGPGAGLGSRPGSASGSLSGSLAAGGGSGPASMRISLASLRLINSGIERMVLQRYGTRRGLIALGRALPLGLGAAIGGGANYTAIRTLARNAEQFFSRLPYAAIDTTAIDTTST